MAIAAGDILFFKGDPKVFINRVIMKRTNSPYVHVAIALENQLIIQAVTQGVQIAKLPPYAAAIAHVGQSLQKKNPSEFVEEMTNLMALAGKVHYGFSDILSQALNLLPGHPTLSFDRSEDCSHLAVTWLQAVGYDLPLGTEANRVTPGSLFTMLNLPGVIEIH